MIDLIVQGNYAIYIKGRLKTDFRILMGDLHYPLDKLLNPGESAQQIVEPLVPLYGHKV